MPKTKPSVFPFWSFSVREGKVDGTVNGASVMAIAHHYVNLFQGPVQVTKYDERHWPIGESFFVEPPKRKRAAGANRSRR